MGTARQEDEGEPAPVEECHLGRLLDRLRQRSQAGPSLRFTHRQFGLKL
jgi:hypothetical protein